MKEYTHSEYETLLLDLQVLIAFVQGTLESKASDPHKIMRALQGLEYIQSKLNTIIFEDVSIAQLTSIVIDEFP